MPSSADAAIADRLEVGRALAGTARADFTHIRRGGNSRVYRMDTPGGRFALKLYPDTAGDPRDRLGTEWAALAFLARHGDRRAPRALAADRERRVALYEWIDGRPVEAPLPDDIDAALAFAGTLHRLRRAEGAAALPLASEACLSLAELAGQIERRLDRLREAATRHDDLRDLLDRRVAPALAPALATVALDTVGAVPPDARTLSPSDFGFHNALRRPGGTLAFLDFEYFGWDDPVKLAADFVLHPGMRLTGTDRRRFLAGCDALYGDDRDFARRLKARLMLYGLRWCMILLNEFLPERWERRVRSGQSADHRGVLTGQIAKVISMLDTVPIIEGMLHGG
ncbi:hypothetical protein [Azospirillum sp.]|uniref:phosphotransferase family protein n=1 Tax=Azospirillum sp. TaxID=34012 RepID=UPI002D7552FF|nr:hypothetical protein [Azospirillum sp.]HYD70488.1 hypothetical protein [Azospirillum sp.]